MKAIDVLCSQPWAIQPEWLETLVDFAERVPTAVIQAKIAEREGTTVEAVRARVGDPMDNMRRGYRRDGVAVINMHGPIIPRASLFSEMSGATSVESLALDLTTALEDPSVTAIVLNVDSPGGQVTGVSELAAMIAEYKKKKPICVFAEGLCASAAYWISSAASEIVVANTAMAGSIGTVMVADTRRREGEVQIVSSQSPHKRPDLTTQAGKSRVQALVDQTTDVFIDSVAKYRAVSRETVMKDFGQGDVLLGAKAVKAGMADRVGSFEGLISDLQSGYVPKPRKPEPKSTAKSKKGSSMNVSEFRMMLGRALGLTADATESDSLEGNASETSEPVRDPVVPAAVLEAKRKAEEEAAQLRAALEKQVKANHEHMVTSVVDRLVREGNLLPAEREAATKILGRALADDHKHGAEGGSRFDTLADFLQARVVYKPTETLATDDTGKPVAPKNGRLLDREPPVEETAADEATIQKLLGMTDIGRNALKTK